MTTTATRAQLQQYFATNCIPTQSNFTDLINGMLNQTDDGIVKSAGNPLSIAAAGDATTSQKVLNLYANLSDQNPAWTLQLNPRSNQNDSTTAHSGFSVSDATGTSRLFIDAGSYNVGIGTNTPKAMLDINGGANVGTSLNVGAGLTVSGSQVFIGQDIIPSPTSNIKTNSVICFAQAIGEEQNAGKVIYKPAWCSNALTIVGAGTQTGNRAIALWDNVTVESALTIVGQNIPANANALTVTGAALFNNALKVSGAASFSNSLTVSAGNVRIGYDDQNNGTGRIVCFQKDSGDDINAGKIIYKPNWSGTGGTALNITGAGTSNSTRNIKLWDNVEVTNILIVDGPASLNNTLSVSGAINASGKVNSPFWNITNVMSNQRGALGLSGTFNCHGGHVLIFVSGSGMASSGNNVLIGMTVTLDNTLLGNVEVFTNANQNHASFIPALFTANPASGNHTIYLNNLSGTLTDGNDYFTVTVMEFPY